MRSILKCPTSILKGSGHENNILFQLILLLNTQMPRRLETVFFDRAHQEAVPLIEQIQIRHIKLLSA